MLGGKVESVEEFQIPGTDIERTFVKIKKERQPRKDFREKRGCLPKIHFRKECHRWTRFLSAGPNVENDKNHR